MGRSKKDRIYKWSPTLSGFNPRSHMLYPVKSLSGRREGGGPGIGLGKHVACETRAMRRPEGESGETSIRQPASHRYN